MILFGRTNKTSGLELWYNIICRKDTDVNLVSKDHSFHLKHHFREIFHVLCIIFVISHWQATSEGPVSVNKDIQSPNP